MKYDVFISCKSDKYNLAEKIYNFLTTNGVNVFFAKDILKKIGSADYGETIDNALDQSSHLIVFCTSASEVEKATSPYVHYEWTTFNNEQRSGRKSGNLITILKDVNVADLPIALRKMQSFSYDNFEESLLSYVETPEHKPRENREENPLPMSSIGRKEWLLNLVDYSLEDMYNSSSVKAKVSDRDCAINAALDASNPKYTTLECFKKVYNEERGSTHDSKNAAFYFFCHSVKPGDIIYLAKSSDLYAYAIVTGDSVQTDVANKEHIWKVKWHKYDRIITIDKNIATPFFVNLNTRESAEKREKIVKAVEKQTNLK